MYVPNQAAMSVHPSVVLHSGAVIGRIPRAAGVISNPPKVERETIIGPGCVIGANAVIYAGVQLGANVLIGDGTTIRENTTVGDDTVIGSNCTVQNGATIGSRVKIVDLSHITYDCTIGDEAFISVGVYTMNDNSMQRGGEVVGPKIGKRARIGGGAMLLPGVRIGDDAIVAAGSVVTKDVAPGTQVMGVPARTRQQIPVHDVEKEMIDYPDGWPPRPYAEWPPE